VYGERAFAYKLCIQNDVCLSQIRKKLSYRRGTARHKLCQLKSCQRLHRCTKSHIWTGLHYVN